MMSTITRLLDISTEEGQQLARLFWNTEDGLTDTYDYEFLLATLADLLCVSVEELERYKANVDPDDLPEPAGSSFVVGMIAYQERDQWQD